MFAGVATPANIKFRHRTLLGYLLALLLAALLSAVPRTALANGGGGDDGPIDPSTISFDQNVNAQLPLDLNFQDESGATVQLRRYFSGKPVILIFAYYDCPMLCDVALSDLAQNLKGLKDSAGQGFVVLTVSFNPVETPEMAAAKKAEALKIYDRPQVDTGWHFLVGQQAPIEQLTQLAGFHYQYDPELQEYAHPTGVIVLTPEGKIERYIFGIDYNATDLRLALLDATDRKTASPIDQVFFLCYHYNPVTGKYTVAINQILRLAGIGTVALLGGLIVFLSFKPGGGPSQRLKSMLSGSRASRQDRTRT